jgi:hypothetical protein
MGQSAITGINLGVPAYQANFTNGDLVAGVLTVNHGLNSQYVSVTVYNNSNLIIIPDDVTASSTTQCTIDLTSYGTLTGTWRAVIIDKGATNSYSAPVVPRFKAYNSGNISLTDRTFQTYVPDIEIFDEGGYFDLGGTSRYTPLVAGVYFFYFFS